MVSAFGSTKRRKTVLVHFEKRLILVLLYSVLSVYSVVLACKITTEYTENTEKTRNKKSNISDCTASHKHSTGVDSS